MRSRNLTTGDPGHIDVDDPSNFETPAAWAFASRWSSKRDRLTLRPEPAAAHQPGPRVNAWTNASAARSEAVDRAKTAGARAVHLRSFADIAPLRSVVSSQPTC